MNLLHIDSSISGNESISRELTKRIVERIRLEYADVRVTYRDLAVQPIEHLGAAEFASLVDGEAIAEFMVADVIVVGAPTYNFTISTQLKAWLDRIIVAGKTFAYTKAGASGLAGGRRVIVVNTRGGIYSEGSPYQSAEHAQSLLHTAFGFMGIVDVEFIIAEGIRVSPDLREAALTAARAAAETFQLKPATA